MTEIARTAARPTPDAPSSPSRPAITGVDDDPRITGGNRADGTRPRLEAIRPALAGGGHPVGWQPVLDGEDARIAGAVAREIAESLVDIELGDAPPMHGGHAGLALMYRYLSRLDDGAWDRAAERHLARALAHARSGPSLSLQFGGVGVAWLMHRCRDLLGDTDPCRAIDAAIRDVLATATEPLAFSFALGLAGVAIYALERDDREMMALVARRLVDRAERTSGGARWKTLPEHMRPEARAELPDGHYNLGLMHGGPGALAALAMLARALGDGGESSRGRGPLASSLPAFMPAAALVCRSTARVGLEWLLACRRGPRGGERMLPSDDASPPPMTFQASWCYSELGIACALHATADPTLAAAARDLGDFAIERCSRNTYGRDAGLCHGAAGVGHMMSRLAQHTDDPRARKIAKRSYRRAIARLHRREQRIAVGDEGTWKSWDEHPGLVDGAAGVALALAAATSTIEPDWDRVLLMG